MTRKFFHWHPNLNCLAKDIKHVLIRLRDQDDGSLRPVGKNDVGFVDADDVATYMHEQDKYASPRGLTIKAPWPVTWMEYIAKEDPESDKETDKMLRQYFGGELYVGTYIITEEVPEDKYEEVLANDAALEIIAQASGMIVGGEETLAMWREHNRRNGREAYMQNLSRSHECHTIQIAQLFTADRRDWFDVGFVVQYLDKRGREIEDSLLELYGEAEGGFIESRLDVVNSPFVMCLGLLNCKNVKTKMVEPTSKQRKKLKRTGSPVIRMHTLIIHPFGKRYGSGSGTEAKLPWHMCRGHFKTFTEEKPLLGKPWGVGTWWWNPTVRGSKQRGQVHKDYLVENE